MQAEQEAGALCSLHFFHSAVLWVPVAAGYTGLGHNWGIPNLGNSILWGNHWQICLAFAPEDTLALISWIASRTLICPRGRCHSVSQAVCYINVFEKIVQNKSCSRTCRKRGIHEDLSLNNSYLFLYTLDFCWIFPWVCYSIGHSY